MGGTSGSGSERSPRWSADGRTLSYISTREEGAQIWRLPIRGGEPTRLTAVPGGISEFWVSPGGKALFYVKDVKWPAQAELDLRHGGFPTEAMLWTELFYRHWNEWRVGLRQHLFRLEPGDSIGTDVTPYDRDVPTLALGGIGVALSQFGTEVAVVLNPDSSLATSTNNEIYVMGPDGSGRQAITNNLTNDNPRLLPDSRYVAYRDDGPRVRGGPPAGHALRAGDGPAAVAHRRLDVERGRHQLDPRLARTHRGGA
jgi:Tol biopolymer transport system component